MDEINCRMNLLFVGSLSDKVHVLKNYMESKPKLCIKYMELIHSFHFMFNGVLGMLTLTLKITKRNGDKKNGSKL